MGIEPAVRLAWAIANAEACMAGSRRIEPVHFVIAVLKIVDDGFQQDADRLDLPLEAGRALPDIAAQGRARLRMADEEITKSRRRLREVVRAGTQPGLLRMLHRSSSSRDLFDGAVARAADAGSRELTFFHLLDELLDNPPPPAVPFLPAPIKASASPGAGVQPAKTGAQLAGRSDELDLAPERSATPALDQLGRDLSALARAGRLAPVVGREREIKGLARYLQRTTKANAILIGDAGVGKTAIVEGLAQRLAAPGAPEFLRTLRIVELSVADLLAGTKYRGAMEERVQQLIAEATGDPDVIVFLDEIHLVMSAGSGGEAPLDVANILKPALGRDEFRCIGATTTEEFERHIKGDAAFTRRFQMLRIGEPSQSEAQRICTEWARRIEELQGVAIDDDAVAAAVELSARLIRQRSLPDKAIDLLENAVAFVMVSSLSFGDVVPSKEPPRIGREEIQRVLEEQYGISVTAARALDVERVRSVLQSELVGQDEAIDGLVESLSAQRVRPEDAQEPLGVFLFTGPTGVGKTLAAECLGRALFGTGSRFAGRFNMSEYKERHELARLIGAPPGFVGHEQQGALFRYAEANPQGLILLDEMEKAHPEIQDYLLQVFDKGVAADSRGRTTDFRPYVFVLTCNVLPNSRPPVGFGLAADVAPADHPADIEEELQRHFRREFLGRVDRLIAFRPLAPDDYLALLDRQLSELAGRLDDGQLLDVDDLDRGRLCESWADDSAGARGFIRRFRRAIADPVLQYARDNQSQSVIRIRWENGAPTLS